MYAGAVIEKVTIGREQLSQKDQNRQKSDKGTDRPTNQPIYQPTKQLTDQLTDWRDVNLRSMQRKSCIKMSVYAIDKKKEIFKEWKNWEENSHFGPFALFNSKSNCVFWGHFWQVSLIFYM